MYNFFLKILVPTNRDIHTHSKDLLANKGYCFLNGTNLYFLRNKILIKTKESYRVSKQITSCSCACQSASGSRV